MSSWEQLGAHAGHWILYALILAIPLSGWACSSALRYHFWLKDDVLRRMLP